MYLKPEKGKYKDLEKDMPIKREYKRAYKTDKKCGCDSSCSCCNQRRKNRCN